MSAREVSTETKDLIRAAISNAYYEARNTGRTMEQAADDAVTALVPILLSCDENAHGRGVQEERDRYEERVQDCPTCNGCGCYAGNGETCSDCSGLGGVRIRSQIVAPAVVSRR